MPANGGFGTSDSACRERLFFCSDLDTDTEIPSLMGSPRVSGDAIGEDLEYIENKLDNVFSMCVVCVVASLGTLVGLLVGFLFN